VNIKNAAEQTRHAFSTANRRQQSQQQQQQQQQPVVETVTGENRTTQLKESAAPNAETSAGFLGGGHVSRARSSPLL
jgi:hypothetical protein